METRHQCCDNVVRFQVQKDTAALTFFACLLVAEALTCCSLIAIVCAWMLSTDI